MGRGHDQGMPEDEVSILSLFRLSLYMGCDLLPRRNFTATLNITHFVILRFCVVAVAIAAAASCHSHHPVVPVGWLTLAGCLRQPAFVCRMLATAAAAAAAAVGAVLLP